MDPRKIARDAMTKATETERTVTLAYDDDVRAELLAHAARFDQWTGVDARDYYAFTGPSEAWRVVLVAGSDMQD